MEINVIWAAVLGYALGSIPFGLILTKLAGLGDVRQIGSGNIGATNVLRTGNKGLAAATVLFDIGKGFLPSFLVARFMTGDVLSISMAMGTAGLFAVLGHCFPIWLKFKGGKGVATYAGACFGFAWPLGLAYAALWIGTLLLSRISSLSGLTAALLIPLVALALSYAQFAPFLAMISLLIFWLHRANIARLRAGVEPKIGKSARGNEQADGGNDIGANIHGNGDE